MRKMWIGMMALMVLCGCSKSGKTEVSISSDMLLEKIEEKETFVVVINQTSSQAGMNFRRTFVPFMREHEKLPIYEIMLDEQGTKKQDASMAMSKLVNEVTEFDGNIPAMLYYKDGEVSKQTSGALSEIAWTNFLKECDIMKGEKEEESQYKMAESEQFQTDLQQLYQDWKQGNEMYLFVGENDKYSMMFSETLKKNK